MAQAPSWRGNRGTRQERGYGAGWERIRKLVIKRDGAFCQPCLRQGRYTPFNEVDHIKPKSQGGDDDMGNLECICTPCHASKTAAEGREGRRRTGSREAHGIPSGMKPSAVPGIIIAGPPASGKTTHAHAIAREGDTIIDLDDIAERIAGQRWTGDLSVIGKALDERDAILCGLHARRGGRVILIVTGETPEARKAWLAAIGNRARLHVMQVSAAECIRRIKADPARAHAADRQAEVARRWR